MSAFQASEGVVVRGSDGEEPGHPVIVPSALFSQMRNLDGDQGAKGMLQQTSIPVRMVDIGKAALIDVDDVKDLVSAGGLLVSTRI
ncbi:MULTISPECIES: hypothetical protein [unclassified Burkholderia]|uniref:hypothetical protein n=1 Tax=unclassified Burkholderia TaxID=2613784 RepID=UPI0021500954|nr:MULTISPECIES: hypothetical protein [unclassified Burkholderia]MCR4469818.1 hypothetical protein [Burkholderia sp. SCN-KJ]